MHLDSFTILVGGCAVLMLQGSTFIFFWLRDRSSPWLVWWGVPLLFGGAAIALYARPSWETDYIAIAFGNAFRILTLACLWQGVRLFEGRRVMYGALALSFFGWIGLTLIPGITDLLALRIVLVSLINGAICIAAALELRQSASDALPSRRPLMFTFASFAVVMLARVGTASWAPFPMGAGPADGLWLGGFVMLVFIHSAFAAILFFSLTRERREAEQRSFAMSDPLTGLLNRRAFSDYAERLDRRRAGQRDGLTLLVLDLDHFKSINDRFGHETGDRLLKAFAETAEQSVRPSDQLFRIGGEEFCFILPDTPSLEGIAVAERIRAAFAATQVATTAGPAMTTVSIGLAATQHPVAVDVLLAAADAAVYEAKARGRNRVVVAEPASLMRASAGDGAATRRRA